MKRALLAISALAVVLSSCQVERDKSVSFKASILPTKTTLDEGAVSWSEDDQVSINGDIFTATGTGTVTTFVNIDSEIVPPYNAIFPVSLVNGDSYELPGTQTYSASNVDNLPMYATSTDNNLAFQNICGVIGVTVKSSDMASVKSIKVSCSNRDMYGAFTISENKAVLNSTDNGNKSVVLNCSEAISTTEDGTTFYIALPSGDYETLKVELSADGNSYTKTMNARKSSISIAANTIYPWNFTQTGRFVLSDSPTVSSML